MMKIVRMLLTLLCFVALVYGQPSPDTATMFALRDSLKSKNLNWSDPNPCLWTGVGCDTGSQRVNRIEIGNRGISGTLTSSLSNLSALTVFEVTVNNLTGKIPSLAGLKSLESILLNDNGFTSIDTDFFTGLSSLQFVNLDNNPLRPWNIPYSLTDAASLVSFSAANSNISGEIPDLHWNVTFPTLSTLTLSSNSLVGELPTSFAGSSIQVLMLNEQNLNGSISVLAEMPGLTKAWLQENRFSGAIPVFSGLTSLKLLNVSGNQLTGTVPDSLTELTSLSDLALGNNLLQGPTPSFKSRSVTLDIIGLNSFCLDVPGAPCDPRVNDLLSIVEGFGFPVVFAESWKGNDPCNSTNKWVGITCSGADITVIDFKGMGLNGTISPSFARLTTLKVINLSHNNLHGYISGELTDELRNLETIDVSYNHQLYDLYFHFEPNVVVVHGDPATIYNVPPQFPVGSSSQNNNVSKIVGSVIGSTVFVLLLIGFAIFLCVKKKKAYHKMHPSNILTLQNLRVRWK